MSHLSKVNAMSVDVEDYFQVSNFDSYFPRNQWDSVPCRIEKSCAEILGILESRDVQATFFILGWIAEKYPNLVRDIHRRGHEIASHGSSHCLVYSQDREAFRADIRRSKSVLEEIIDEPIAGFRAPSFSRASILSG